MNIDVLESIKDNDLLGRAIFQSKYAKSKIHPRVFIEKRNCSISMDRFGFCSDKDLINIQDKNAQSRGSQRSFYGWAKLKAIDARKENREVKSTPIKENPYHADIILPKDTKDDLITHATSLAVSSDWKPR